MPSGRVFVWARWPNRRALPRFFAVLATASLVLAACGGGGGGGSSVPPTSASTPTPTPTPVTSQTQSVPVSTTGSQTATYAVAGYSSTATIPAGNVATTLSTTFSTTQPSGTPTIQNLHRRPQNIGASPIGALAYLCIMPAATVRLTAYPSFTLTVPAASGLAYVALFDPTNPSAGWTTIEGPGLLSGTTLLGEIVSFTGGTPGPTLQGGQTYCLLFFTLASALPTPTPTPTPVATSTANAQAYVCPTSGTTGTSTARLASSGRFGEATTRAPRHTTQSSTAPLANTLLAVSYNRSAVSANLPQIAGRELAAGASFLRSYDFPNQNIAMRVVSVPTAKVAQTEALLRTQAGVQSIGVTGERRFPLTTNAVTTNDPYFMGFGANKGTKYAESPAIPGQWDMWAIGLPNAYGYSQAAGNSLGTANLNALGSASIKIAIIDTGEDASHPELNSNLPYQKCYITNQAGTSQSTGNFSTDPLGHGTDVSGIAAAASNNGLGFTGAGGKAVIYGYRIFPTPNDNCANSNSTDPQCGSDTSDIVSAITDAVQQQHVNIISMSLGGGSCSNGADSDVAEGAAVASAIAAGVIVIAASGNSGTQGVTAPACDTSVIAVGATSLDDGTPTGTTAYTSSNVGSASAANPVEYVASYSQYGSPGAALRSASAWGIVAPGGDPSSIETSATATAAQVDDLHWIENIWTSTPFQSSSSDTSFTGECTDDYPNSSGLTPPVDCRTLIAGTSMSTPHVAGAAALILAVAPQYGTPSLMKQLLCSTADNLNDSHQGCGRLNVYTAMAKALIDPSPPTPIP